MTFRPDVHASIKGGRNYLGTCAALLIALSSITPGSRCPSATPEDSPKPTAPESLLDKTPPERVRVLPVFFVPQGQQPPVKSQIDRVSEHLKWAQARYGELLRHDTFAIAEQGPKVYFSQHPVSFYRDGIEGSAAQFTAELLADLKCNRFNCPYVFLVFVSNDDPAFSRCGGRPLNGGFNNGGGIVEWTCDFEHTPGLQNTLQHELGHAFGLSHPDVYGYSMQTNASFMSYNPAFYTDGFKPSRTPGILIPEDLQRLSLNKRVFAEYRFDPARDVPAGYAMKEAEGFPPMAIPGQEAIPGQDGTPPFAARLAGKVPLVVKVRLEHDGERTGRECAWVGSKGRGQKMLGFSVEFPEKIPGVQLQYMASIFTIDNTPWVEAGTFLSKAQLEHAANPADKPAGGDPSAMINRLAFRLTGEASGKYEVWYQGHFSNLGDSAWFKDGEFCGPPAPNFQFLESFVVAVVPK